MHYMSYVAIWPLGGSNWPCISVENILYAASKPKKSGERCHGGQGEYITFYCNVLFPSDYNNRLCRLHYCDNRRLYYREAAATVTSLRGFVACRTAALARCTSVHFCPQSSHFISYHPHTCCPLLTNSILIMISMTLLIVCIYFTAFNVGTVRVAIEF